jgi:hypothetical protein
VLGHAEAFYSAYCYGLVFFSRQFVETADHGLQPAGAKCVYGESGGVFAQSG